MKEIKTTADIANATAIDLGPLAEIKDYVLELGPDVKIPGKVRARCSAELQSRLAARTSRCKCSPPARRADSTIRTRNTKSCTSSFQERANIRSMARTSPSKRVQSCVSLPQASAPSATRVRHRSQCSAFSTGQPRRAASRHSRAGQRHASRRNDSRRSGKVVVESDKGKGTKEVRS